MFTTIYFTEFTFYRVDEKRIQEVGANRACAEWLLKCGAQFRWNNSAKFVTNFNLLANSSVDRSRVLEEIDADEARIMDIGFPHFSTVKPKKKFNLIIDLPIICLLFY